MRPMACFFLAATVFLVSACQKGRNNDPPGNIDQYMVSLSAQAVERARSGYGINLDYRPDSVKEVEKLLATKYDFEKTHPMTEQEIAEAAHLWGSYIGEVIKRIHPAHWVRDSEIAGQDAFPIVYEDKDGESYPCAWVYNRLKNGEEDNVWTKFHFFTQPGGVKKYFPTQDKPDPSSKNKNAPKS